jgi:hypothetical protein
MTDPDLLNLIGRLGAVIPRGGRKAAAEELDISQSYLSALLKKERTSPSSEVRQRLQAFVDRRVAIYRASALDRRVSPMRTKVNAMLDVLEDDGVDLEGVLAFLRALGAKRWTDGTNADTTPGG